MRFRAGSCDICRHDEDGVYVVGCLHVVEGDLFEDEDGNDLIASYRDNPEDVRRWLCPDTGCPEFALCAQCWTDLPAATQDVQAALARLAVTR